MDHRHCEPPGRAYARPMINSAKQSIVPCKEKMDCFVASAPRNDGSPNSKRNFAFPRRDAPEACIIVSPSENRGRRESRMRAAPAVSCASCTKKYAHEHTGSAENIRPSLRNGFTAYFALSLVSRALLPPSPARSLALTNLAPASGARTTRLRRPHQRRSSKAHPRPPHLYPRS